MVALTGITTYWNPLITVLVKECTLGSETIFFLVMGHPRKKQMAGGGGLRTYFFEKKPRKCFIFFTLPLEIPDKTKLHPWKFRKIVLHPLEIPRSKTKTPPGC